jgi:hypothetical protein
MPPDKAERRPRRKGGALEIAHDDGDNASIRPRRPGCSANPSRELLAWKAAVEHLHESGLPAAVPPFVAAWLGRRGVRADWRSAA